MLDLINLKKMINTHGKRRDNAKIKKVAIPFDPKSIGGPDSSVELVTVKWKYESCTDKYPRAVAPAFDIRDYAESIIVLLFFL